MEGKGKLVRRQKVIRVGLYEELTVERHNENETSNLGNENTTCKCPEVETCLSA